MEYAYQEDIYHNQLQSALKLSIRDLEFDKNPLPTGL